MKIRRNQQRGLSIIELLVSMTVFSVVSAAAVTFVSDSLRRLSLESKVALATKELKNSVALMQSELRMSASVSPYNVGIDANLVTCRSQLTTTSTTVRFLVAHDDPSGTSGTQVYYVGYEYSPSDNTLYRGEIIGSNATSCTLPAGDPLSIGTRKVLAKNVVRIDADNNGSIDNPFTRVNNQLFIRLGAEVSGSSGLTATQKVTDTVFTRAT
jgi:prepilin-type N-terminal cleavage/methylation domain-containing protein